MAVLLIICAYALYTYSNYEKEKAEKQTATKITSLISKDSTAEVADTIEVIEPPSALDIPQHQTYSFGDSFDNQAHLQLMRQNASQYNYKLAYQHGHRIANYLLAEPKLTEEWGHVLLEAGKPADAVSVLERVVFNDTINSSVLTDMAFAMFRSGNTEGALDFLASKGNDVNLLAATAAIMSEHPDAAKRPKAEPIFKSALKKNPSLPSLNYWYGRFLMQRGDFQNSKVYLEKAVKAKPNEPRYIARLGMAEFYLKHDLDAETLYKKALNINPYDYNTWFSLGELYLSQANESYNTREIRQKTHIALESYLKAVENDSLHANAHYRIGLILNGNGGYKEAIKHLTMALEKMPDHIPSMQQLSSAYLQINDTAKTVDYLNKILEIDPFNKIAGNEFRRLNGKKRMEKKE
jgi:tetratricopeptide (TPR) repeat protein